jgi:hypothetical protein
MNALAQYGPPLIFFLGMLTASRVVIRFNLITWRIAKQIKDQAASEGKEWELFGRPDRMRQFLFRPSALIEFNDSIAMAHAKQLLIAHRKAMWRNVFLGWGIMLGTVVSIVLFVVVLAQFA